MYEFALRVFISLLDDSSSTSDGDTSIQTAIAASLMEGTGK